MMVIFISAGAAVLKELKVFWPEYTKAVAGVFLTTMQIRNDELGYAKTNAKRALIAANENRTDNPSTTVHLLVDYLQQINSNKTQ